MRNVALNWNGVVRSAVVLICAGAIKLFYSSASVNDLRWILAPTTLLVEVLTGTKFAFESNAGYMSADHSFIIAASCSGVNFLITAFLMLSIGTLWRGRGKTPGWRFLPASLFFAYLTTIIANTVRITTAFQIRHLDTEWIWLNPDQLHRFEGIIIYFGFLLFLFVLSERVGSNAGSGPKPGLLRRTWLPLLIYYTTTLGIPFVNGAYRSTAATASFWEHSIFVLLVPVLPIIILATIAFMNGQRTISGVRSFE